MKKLLLLLSVVALAFTGCYEDVGPEYPDAGQIELSQNYIESDYQGGWNNVYVTSNYTWYAYSNDSWITLDNNYGPSGTSSLSFTVSYNSSESDRYGSITVYTEDYNLTTSISVYQYGYSSTVLGAGEFEISVSNVGETSADMKVAPKQEGRTFYWNIVAEAFLNEFATSKAYMEDYHAYLASVVDAGYSTWEEILDSEAVEYTTTKLNPETKYVLWAFGIDAQGNLTSSDLSYVKFETPVSTFDPTTWYGYWNVTAPKQVQIGEDPMSGYLIEEAIEEPLEKVLAITDASADFGEGYVYVWGWDGAFDLEMPAVGLVSANNIKLMNETVLFTEEDETFGPLDYTWLGFSDLSATHGGWYTIGGDYAAYTLSMDADKNVTITAYKGQIVDGTPFMTDYYALAAVITTGEYEGRSLSFSRADGMPACYLSGAEMTAEFLAPLEEVAAKKLNANKKFKAYTMMATPKAAAQKFTAARFVK